MTTADAPVGTTVEVSGDEIADGIAVWLEMEGPTLDVEAVNRMVDTVQTAFEAAGLTTRRAPGEDGYGDLALGLRPRDAEPDGPKANKPGILVLSHIDTVHPIGTKKEGNPIRRDGDKLYGPGVYDMKAGRLPGF